MYKRQLTGSSLATCTAIGTMMIPEMEKRGYSRPYSGALIAASGFLGILIPPSIPGIMFAMMSGSCLLYTSATTVPVVAPTELTAATPLRRVSHFTWAAV